MIKIIAHTKNNSYTVIENEVGQFICIDSTHEAIKKQLIKFPEGRPCCEPLIGQYLIINGIDHYNDVITSHIIGIDITT